ncbi:MAG: methylmalonyl-CoA mutase family protein, partial [Gemmatimonadaceae bacterium]
MTSTPDLSEAVAEQRAELERLRAEVETWRARFAKGETREVGFVNSAGEIEPLFTPLDVQGGQAADLGVPGAFPYTRGVHPTGYRGKLWTMRQFAGFGSAEDTNERFKFLLDHGQTGLSTAFDFPTLMGYDSDHPRSLGEVGKTGVAISSLADMEVLFDGIPLDQVST